MASSSGEWFLTIFPNICVKCCSQYNMYVTMIHSSKDYTHFVWDGGTCPRFARAGGTFSPVVLLLELYPICLLAVWPVSVSYRHLPVGIFGMVCTVFFAL